MPRIVLALALGTACTPQAPTVSSLTAPVVPPPTSELQLAADQMVPGETATWIVDGLQPGERAYVVRGRDLGPGVCPPIVGGMCMDITGTPSLLVTGRADGTGTAVLTLTVPGSAPVGAVVSFQAVALPGTGRPDAAKSNPVLRTVHDGPPDDLSTADLVITEIMADPTAAPDSDGEWFEVTNAGAAPVSLEGLTVADAGGSFIVDRPLVAEPGEHVVFARTSDPTVNGGLWADHVWTTSFALTNGSDTLRLEDGARVIDAVSWTSTVSGSSRALAPGLGAPDNDADTAWCLGQDAYGGGDLGTPGEPNPACGVCGDGVVDAGEECDAADGSCSATCTLLGSCGDGIVQGGEACDAGALNGTMAATCAHDCTASALSYTPGSEQHVTLGNTGGPPNAQLVVASWPNDTVPDVWLAWREEAVAVEGRGDGSFHVPPAVECGLYTTAVDLDGDGLEDLVGVPDPDDILRICWNEGGGLFTEVDLAVPVSANTRAPVVGDLDRDGHPDLVWTDESSHGVQVLMGTGSRTLGSPSFTSTVGPHGGTSPRDPLVVDLDGDLRPDLVTRHTDLLVVQYGLGDGSFGAVEPIDVAWAGTVGPSDVDVADLDDDGHLDLVVLMWDTVLQVPGTASDFGSPVEVATVDQGAHLVVADLDDDGHDDLLVDERGTLVRYPGLPGAALVGPGTDLPSPVVSPTAGSGFVVEDLEGDGDLDVVVVASDSGSLGDRSAYTLIADGGAFTPSTPVSVGVHPPAVIDLDDDGRRDVYVAGTGTHLDDTGALRVAVRHVFPSTTHDAVILDATGDGLPDVASDYDTAWYVTQPGRAVDTFGHLAHEGGYGHMAMADVNLDGHPDFITVSDWGFDGRIDIGLGDGRGSFRYSTPEIISRPLADASQITTADVNGDGRPDLLVSDRNTHTLHVRLGIAPGTFDPSFASFPMGGEVWQLEVGEVTGDGVADVVAASEDDDAIYVLPGYGDGSFAAPITVFPLAAPVDIRAADGLSVDDLDGDGIGDLAIALSHELQVAVARSFGGGVFGQGMALPTSDSPRDVVVADMDLDGRRDLVVAIDGGILQTWRGLP